MQKFKASIQMKISASVFLAIILLSCNSKVEQKAVDKTDNVAQNEAELKTQDFDLEVYDFEGLSPLLNKTDGKTYVINFWATWCAPCVKELPYFEKLQANYNSKNVEVILVSLDFPHQYETKLKPFIKTHNLKSKVVVLDDADANSWIPKVSENWSGSIPATIIYKNNKRGFYEQSFTYDELENELQKF
ncbi:TlpA disulfide reductase family protein [Seonamhaeicola algicola]|nr:TlpA disulfide reductase family protein [Seonamhaeicola algicola]